MTTQDVAGTWLRIRRGRVLHLVVPYMGGRYYRSVCTRPGIARPSWRALGPVEDWADMGWRYEKCRHCLVVSR
jgi:hypothetical protein